jgi:hypothetical protein
MKLNVQTEQQNVGNQDLRDHANDWETLQLSTSFLSFGVTPMACS